MRATAGHYFSLTRLAAAFPLIALMGCGGGAPPPTADVDPANRFFEQRRVLEVQVDLPQASWDELRNQTRRRIELLEGDCLAQPFTNPFTYFEGSITIDGERRDHVGIRKKGFIGSLDTTRPALKVHFDEYTKGGNLLGLNHLTLNNSRQDASYLRQCIAYQAFADAGIPSPRCGFVHMVVNGQNLGVYLNVETIDKDFLARHFENDDGELWKAIFADFRPGWTGTFDPQSPGFDPKPILDLTAAIDDSVPDAQLESRVSKVLDLDQFLTYWAMEVMLGHWDGYAYNQNNYYVYRDPATNRLLLLPWGTDGVFRVTGLTGPLSVFARGALTRRLYLNQEIRARYVERLRRVLDVAWNEPALLAETDRREAMLTPFVQKAGGSLTGFRGAVEAVRTFIKTRRANILAEIAGGPPDFTPTMRSPPCHTTLGQIAGRVSTSYDSLSADPFRAGSGEISVTLQGQPISLVAVGGAAGPDPAQPTTRVQVLLAAAESTGTVLGFITSFDRYRLAPRTVIPLDFGSSARCDVVRIQPQTGAITSVGWIAAGNMTIDQGSTTNGAPVVARLEGYVIK